MGGARRRKLAGSYSQPDDPLERARRFWCGRGPVPVENFRVPDGLIAITFDVEGSNPKTCMIAADKLVPVLDEISERVRSEDYYKTVRGFVGCFCKAMRDGDDPSLTNLGLLGFWTAFHHPTGGEMMRRKVSDSLRANGKAHITWCFDKNGLAMALAESFVDMNAILEAAPKDQPFLIERIGDDFRANFQ